MGIGVGAEVNVGVGEVDSPNIFLGFLLKRKYDNPVTIRTENPIRRNFNNFPTTRNYTLFPFNY